MKPEARITLNTCVTYGLSMASLLFGLFSSRWILAALGQTDYGLYGVVGGVIAGITFLNVVSSNSIVRFYAVAIGEGGESAAPCEANSELAGWFNAALALQVSLAAIVLVVGWPAGEWAVRRTLSIPPERVEACVWVLRAGLLAAALTVATVPFTAMFTAWQRFGELACMELARSAAIVAGAYGLLSAEGDRLVLFACLLAGISCLLSGVQVVRAISRFKACRLDVRQLVARSRMKALAAYAGWRVLGIFGWLVQKHGGTFAVNLSFGAKANAAYLIAGQFVTHASSLTGALSSALVPALATEKGKQSREAVGALVLKACKFTGLLAAICAVPLVLETDAVLRLWLGTPPSGTAELALAFTAAMTLDSTTAGIVAALSAEKSIGAWQAFECVVLCLTCPVAWLFFRGGLPLSALGYVFAAATVVMTAGRVWFASRMLGLRPADWLVGAILPVAAVVVGSGFAAAVAKCAMAPSLARLATVFATSCATAAALAWTVAMDANERRRTLNMLATWKGLVSHA